MKLAEALLLRSELQKKSGDLETRILENLKVQEGETPFEEPEALIGELMSLEDELCGIVMQINSANNREKLAEGTTLSEALAKRDSLMKKRNALSNIAGSAADREFRRTRSEVKVITVVNVASLQKQKDELSKQIRELDSKIQAANWNIEL